MVYNPEESNKRYELRMDQRRKFIAAWDDLNKALAGLQSWQAQDLGAWMWLLDTQTHTCIAMGPFAEPPVPAVNAVIMKRPNELDGSRPKRKIKAHRKQDVSTEATQ